ncbi:TraB/GumN family protein [Paenibacillus tarimensis]|uniref:TraB/GumN family protein n=1 Tax=Paenibacillus tarimensis TaxID=416012 RepID=UPI001F2F03D2|nr:TraB/GumN family protein [Paenibacillus tarimensis]MCF2946393.1 TraB/GumN family protein [Paenibacillus tarimensis]
MKKLFYAALSVVLSLALVIPVPQASAANNKSPDESKGYLWKLEKGDNSVYLLGSIHVATKEMYPLSSAIEKAFAESDKLVVEADIANTDAEKMGLYTLEKASYPEGETLKDHISPELYSQLQELLKSIGLPADTFDPYEPWYIQMLLANLLGISEEYTQVEGIDQYFLNRAGKREILELEGVEFQIDYFDSMSPSFQEKLLHEALNNPASGNDSQTLDTMALAWEYGDNEKMLSVLNAASASSQAMTLYYQYLNDDRNVGMTEKIKSYLNDGSGDTYFVVAGSAHFLGDSGIVKRLENEGYKLTRL